jgi:hypothetical protein
MDIEYLNKLFKETFENNNQSLTLNINSRPMIIDGTNFFFKMFYGQSRNE